MGSMSEEKSVLITGANVGRNLVSMESVFYQKTTFVIDFRYSVITQSCQSVYHVLTEAMMLVYMLHPA